MAGAAMFAAQAAERRREVNGTSDVQRAYRGYDDQTIDKLKLKVAANEATPTEIQYLADLVVRALWIAPRLLRSLLLLPLLLIPYLCHGSTALTRAGEEEGRRGGAQGR